MNPQSTDTDPSERYSVLPFSWFDVGDRCDAYERRPTTCAHRRSKGRESTPPVATIRTRTYRTEADGRWRRSVSRTCAGLAQRMAWHWRANEKGEGRWNLRGWTGGDPSASRFRS
eukprot:scaffold689_cov333-Pavlova_lutheri.AAC.2